VQRDEVAAREHRARVVEGAAVVAELEGPQTERAGEPEAALLRLVVLRGDGAEGSVELLRPAPLDERLERVDRETTLVRIEGGKRRRAADMAHPVPRLDPSRDLGDGAVGDAED